MQQEVFDGEKLSRIIEKLPKGKPRIDAYEEAIRLADQTQDAYWRLGFRFHYASEVYFQDDPPKCIGAAAEFGPIFEAAPPEIQIRDDRRLSNDHPAGRGRRCRTCPRSP